MSGSPNPDNNNKTQSIIFLFCSTSDHSKAVDANTKAVMLAEVSVKGKIQTFMRLKMELVSCR